MRAIPTLHEVDFGESLTWAPPAGTARYHVWIKTDSPYVVRFDRDPSDMTYGGNSPRWAQVAGYDVDGGVVLDFPVAVNAKPIPDIELTASGIDVGWQLALGLFDGHDPEVLMVTALTPDAKVMSIDRFRLPTPNQHRREHHRLAGTAVTSDLAQHPGEGRGQRRQGEGHADRRRRARADGARCSRSPRRRGPGADRVVRHRGGGQRAAEGGVLVRRPGRGGSYSFTSELPAMSPRVSIDRGFSMRAARTLQRVSKNPRDSPEGNWQIFAMAFSAAWAVSLAAAFSSLMLLSFAYMVPTRKFRRCPESS